MADVGKKKARGVERSGLPVKIMCPDKTLFDGVAESVIIKTNDGYEGFLKDRAACCRLLASEGRIKLREQGTADFKTIKSKGGFAHKTSVWSAVFVSGYCTENFFVALRYCISIPRFA